MKRKVTKTYSLLWLPWHVESGDHPKEKPLPGQPLLHSLNHWGRGHHWCRLSKIISIIKLNGTYYDYELLKVKLRKYTN